MSFAHPDLAVRGDEDIIRLVERVRFGRSSRLIAAGLTQSHQYFSFGTELEDLMANHFCRRCCRGSCRRTRRASRSSWQVVLSVGDPDIAVAVDMNTVRKHDHARPETFD